MNSGEIVSMSTWLTKPRSESHDLTGQHPITDQHNYRSELCHYPARLVSIRHSEPHETIYKIDSDSLPFHEILGCNNRREYISCPSHNATETYIQSPTGKVIDGN
jgi:hypothetical protein